MTPEEQDAIIEERKQITAKLARGEIDLRDFNERITVLTLEQAAQGRLPISDAARFLSKTEAELSKLPQHQQETLKAIDRVLNKWDLYTLRDLAKLLHTSPSRAKKLVEDRRWELEQIHAGESDLIAPIGLTPEQEAERIRRIGVCERLAQNQQFSFSKAAEELGITVRGTADLYDKWLESNPETLKAIDRVLDERDPYSLGDLATVSRTELKLAIWLANGVRSLNKFALLGKSLAKAI